MYRTEGSLSPLRAAAIVASAIEPPPPASHRHSPEHDTSVPSAHGALAGADVELCARADRAEFLAKGQLRSESSQDDPVRRALSWFPLFFLPGHQIALRVVSSSATSTS